MYTSVAGGKAYKQACPGPYRDVIDVTERQESQALSLLSGNAVPVHGSAESDTPKVSDPGFRIQVSHT